MSCRYAGRCGSALAALLAASCAGQGSRSTAPPFASADESAQASASAGDESASVASDAAAASGSAGTATAVPVAPSYAAPAAAAEPLPSEPVYLNGERLADPDLRELQAVLGHVPAPGRYWYDPRSGLWGLEEHGAGGVTRPGLRVPAPLRPDASRGNSGAFVNDRQLTARELATLAQLLGWDAQRVQALAGRYVLDEQGGLYSAQGRYLGSLANAAARAREQSTSPAPCAWLRLGASADALGGTVTINCD